jgi:hypothetical protein
VKIFSILRSGDGFCNCQTLRMTPPQLVSISSYDRKFMLNTVGTLKTGYPCIQALSQGKEQGVYPRAATQAVAPDLASLLRWASAPPRVLRLRLPLPSPGQLRGRHVSCGPSSRCQPGVAPGPPRALRLQLPLPSPGQLRGRHVSCGSSSRCLARGSSGAATCALKAQRSACY